MSLLQLYDKLLRFPLFDGMGHEELTQMVARTKLDFVKFLPGKRVLCEGESCSHLCLLINGGLKAETRSDDREYAVIEEVQAPYIIQPEHIFGLDQKARSTFTTITDANLIKINKTEVARLCEEFMTFRLNMLNYLATRVQQRISMAWGRPPADLRECIIRFFASRCLHLRGRKEFLIYMERLAAELNDSRLDVSRALKALAEDGLIGVGRGRITIPLMERLLTVTER